VRVGGPITIGFPRQSALVSCGRLLQPRGGKGRTAVELIDLGQRRRVGSKNSARGTDPGMGSGISFHFNPDGAALVFHQTAEWMAAGQV